MNRYLLPIAAALIVVIGAVYLITRPASNIGPQSLPSSSAPPASVEGTWDVAFSHQEMLDAGLVDAGEDNDSNFGHFHLTFQAGWWSMSQLTPFQRPGGTGTYTVDATTAHLFNPPDNGTFDMPYTVTATTLTFGPGGPVTFRVRPWARIATEVITQTPEPRDLSAYRQARNAVCADLFMQSMPPDAEPATNPDGAIAVLAAVIARGNDEITRLTALDVPPSIAAEHEATIQATRDSIALLQQEVIAVNEGRIADATSLDQQTGPYSSIVEQFEQKYGLAGCP